MINTVLAARYFPDNRRIGPILLHNIVERLGCFKSIAQTCRLHRLVVITLSRALPIQSICGCIERIMSCIFNFFRGCTHASEYSLAHTTIDTCFAIIYRLQRFCEKIKLQH
jgi:hypothetical protein